MYFESIVCRCRSIGPSTFQANMNKLIDQIEKTLATTRKVCENERLQRIRNEVVRMVRKYPTGSTVTALIMGFYLGKITTRGRRS